MSKVARDKSASETSLKEPGTRNENPSVGFILEAFQKTSIKANNLVDLKKRTGKSFELFFRRKGWFRGYTSGIG